MVNFTILAGGLSAYIASYVFNGDDNTLTSLAKYPTGPNVTAITSHATNKSILYAVNGDLADGALQSFTVGPAGALTLVDTISSGGGSPNHCLSLPTGEVVFTNSIPGSVRVVPTGKDHLHFSDNSEIWTFPVPTDGSQGTAQADGIYLYGGAILIPDKGNDKIWQLGVVRGDPGDYAVHGYIQQPTNSQPHNVYISSLSDNLLYTVHESPPALTLQGFPSYPNGTSDIIANTSITPSDPAAGSVFLGGDIIVPSPTEQYPVTYIYVSSRNIGKPDPRGDTIMIYQKVSNKFILRRQIYTGLNQIRGMASGEQAGSGGDAYIIAAGNDGVKVFWRVDGGDNLMEVAANNDVPERTSFLWLG